MIIRILHGGGFASNCYLLTDSAGERAIVIDPSLTYPEAVSQVGSIPPVSAILLTHAHADHMIGLASWKENTGAPIAIGRGDAYALTDAEANCSAWLGFGQEPYPTAEILLNDKDVIPFGEESLRVLFTPGHTTGAVSYLSSDSLFTGDTLFADGGVGRSDLFGGSEEALSASISLLFSIPGNPTIYPGHGPISTLLREKPYHLI